MPLYVAFIALTKAFDLVSRDGLFKALQKIGCSSKLHSLIESFYSNMKGRVQFNGSSSEPFELSSGAKQGCVLTPTLWNILRYSPQACSWLCNRGYLPANQIRRQAIQPHPPQSQDEGPRGLHQGHAVCWRRSNCNSHPAGIAVADEPLLSGLQGLYADH